MVTVDIHFSSWKGIPFYIVVYGFYVYHFNVNIEVIYIKPIYNNVK